MNAKVPANTKAPTLEQVFQDWSQQWLIIAGCMLAVTLVALVVCTLLNKARKPNLANLFMALPVFATVIPGVFFSLILAYLLFFARTNLLAAPIIYYIPPIWMLISLYLYSKLIDFKDVPGFDRLSGMIVFCVLTFIGILMLFKFRIIAIAWFSPLWAIAAVAGFYLAWKAALSKLRGKD